MYKNYIFDLYGTLVDIHTDEEKRELWEKMTLCYANAGAIYTAEELKKSYMEQCIKEEESLREKESNTYPEIKIDRVFSQLFMDKGISINDQAVSDIAIIFRTLSREYISLYEGVIEMLQGLKADGKKIFLLSNAQRLFTQPEIRLMGLEEYFDDIFISSDYGIKKPDKAYMELLINKHHLQVKDCIMIGNEIKSDIAVANSCGMHSLYFHSSADNLPTEISATYYMADRSYENFNSLYGWIRGER